MLVFLVERKGIEPSTFALRRRFDPFFDILQQFSDLPLAAHETPQFLAFREHYPRIPIATVCYRCILYLRL